MIRRLNIDYSSLYTKGYSASIIPGQYYRSIMESIKEINWVPDSINQSYNFIPDFNLYESNSADISRAQSEKEIAYRTMKRFPEGARSAVESMISDPTGMGVILEIYNVRLDFIDIWDGVEAGLGWHSDMPSRANIAGLIYLDTDDGIIDESYGGGIECGMRELVDGVNWNTHYNNIQSFGITPPKKRTMIWINNMNPMFVHRPVPLANPKSKRLTITFGICLAEK